VSRALEDYAVARGEAIASVLEMLTAEHQLASPGSDVLAATGGDCEMDAAAARLAEAVDDLPVDRWPAGWGKPAVLAGVPSARDRFTRSVLRVLSARYAEESADAAAESEYADEQMALAARNLAADAEARKAASASERGRLL
jgi:hypothetical protein